MKKFAVGIIAAAFGTMFLLPVGQVRARAIVRRVQERRGMAVQIIAMDPEDRARLFQQLRALLPS